MKAPSSKTCQLEMVFSPASDGRPTIYDFLWEHAGPLFHHLNEKNVRVYTHESTLSASQKKSHAFQVAKLSRDKRFNVRARDSPEGEIDATIPVQNLDHFVNAYNVLFDSHFSNLVFETPTTHIDFSKAGDHTIVVETNVENESKIQSFFARQTIAPRIRSLRFGIKQPLQHALERRST